MLLIPSGRNFIEIMLMKPFRTTLHLLSSVVCEPQIKHDRG